MKIRTKANIVKLYSFSDLLDKVIHYPKKIIYNRSKKKLIPKLYKYVLTAKLPDLDEYERKKDYRVVISVTSFPKRFSQLVLTLKSIILQNSVPAKIIVYLGSDTRVEDITSEMICLKKYGVEYRIDKNLNLKGHKKYYYALNEFKNNIVITIDDDIIFPNTMISELINCYNKYPDSVCARRVHKITKNNKDILPYNLWDMEYINRKKPSNRLIATTGAGTLYSPLVIDKLIHSTFNSNDIIALCLEADDIWMKCMEILSSIKVVYAKNSLMGAFIDVDEDNTLMSENVNKGKNDIFLKNVIEKYGIDIKLFMRD